MSYKVAGGNKGQWWSKILETAASMADRLTPLGISGTQAHATQGRWQNDKNESPIFSTLRVNRKLKNILARCGETVVVLTCVVLHFCNIHTFLLNLLTYLTMDLLFGV